MSIRDREKIRKNAKNQKLPKLKSPMTLMINLPRKTVSGLVITKKIGQSLMFRVFPINFLKLST